jgi:hypothetical protein
MSSKLSSVVSEQGAHTTGEGLHVIKEGVVVVTLLAGPSWYPVPETRFPGCDPGYFHYAQHSSEFVECGVGASYQYL